MDKIKQINDLKNWIQVWIINKEESEGWRKLMQKEFDEIGKEKL